MEQGDLTAAFVEWMDKNNFRLNPNTELIKFADERGHSLVAKSKIPKGKFLFEIPSALILGPKTSGIPLKSSASFTRLNSWNKLIVSLMWEDLNPKSPWRPYLDILPKTLNTPLFWDTKDLELLAGTDVEAELGADVIRNDYDTNILPLIEENRSIFSKAVDHFPSYKRFGSLVMAYSFTNLNDEVVMVPMADMLNHKTGHNNARLFMSQGESDEEETSTPHLTYQMKTVKMVPPSAELYNTYGNLGNSTLLRRYGYTDDINNPFNTVGISNALLRKHYAQHPQIINRLDYLEKKDIYVKEEIFSVACANENEDSDLECENHMERLCFILRCLFCGDESWEGWKAALEEMEKKKGDEDGFQVEDIAMKYSKDKVSEELLSLLQVRLSLYPTTLEADLLQLNLKKDILQNANIKPSKKRKINQTQLQQADLPLNLKNALVARISEKNVLVNLINQLQSKPKPKKTKK
uniref:N-lysine methyltransferase n=1 Tax=Arcella intermedia TaxID=1963864 RepID=A0A6B2L374_9EUKA